MGMGDFSTPPPPAMQAGIGFSGPKKQQQQEQWKRRQCCPCLALTSPTMLTGRKLVINIILFYNYILFIY